MTHDEINRLNVMYRRVVTLSSAIKLTHAAADALVRAYDATIGHIWPENGPSTEIAGAAHRLNCIADDLAKEVARNQLLIKDMEANIHIEGEEVTG